MPILNSQIGQNLTAWHYVNIYGATIGDNCKIGSYTEIGNAVIGDNVTIGAHCFIPEGVTIEDEAWVGPMVTVCNDKFPPSGKENWGTVVIRKGARIGAGSIILPNVEIGEGALVGAGSVVTRNVPANETWKGNPCRKSDSCRKTSPPSGSLGGVVLSPLHTPPLTLIGAL